MGKKSRSRMNIPDHISESLEKKLNKIRYFFMWIRIRNHFDSGSVMEKFGSLERIMEVPE
jgi:hypothetical protein